MPLFDYICHSCGAKREVLVRRHDDFVPCQDGCNKPSAVWVQAGDLHFNLVLMERQPSAPSSFVIKGFNAVNGYASPRVFKQDHGNGIKTTVTGNPEAFADGF